MCECGYECTDLRNDHLPVLIGEMLRVRSMTFVLIRCSGVGVTIAFFVLFLVLVNGVGVAFAFIVLLRLDFFLLTDTAIAFSSSSYMSTSIFIILFSRAVFVLVLMLVRCNAADGDNEASSFGIMVTASARVKRPTHVYAGIIGCIHALIKGSTASITQRYHILK